MTSTKQVLIPDWIWGIELSGSVAFNYNSGRVDSGMTTFCRTLFCECIGSFKFLDISIQSR